MGRVAERLLIVNADDFGGADSINQAVAEGFGAGTITSASLMASGPALGGAVEIARGCPTLGLGLHFTLTQARPLSKPGQIPSICQADGRFLERASLLARLLSGRVRASEIAAELEAQYERLTELGLELTHIDGHQHVHVLPGVAPVVLAAAKQRGLAVRMPVEELIWWGRMGPDLAGAARQLAKKAAFLPWAVWSRRRARTAGLAVNDHFRSLFGLAPRSEVSPEAFNRLLSGLKPGLTELMVHPAKGDDGAYLWDFHPRLVADRRLEAEILADPGLAQKIKAAGIQLVNYGVFRD